jgi:hypothetical protein
LVKIEFFIIFLILSFLDISNLILNRLLTGSFMETLSGSNNPIRLSLAHLAGYGASELLILKLRINKTAALFFPIAYIDTGEDLSI